MGIPTTISLQLSVNGGSQVSGGRTISLNDSVVLSIANTSGISSVRYDLFDFPSGLSVPSGWSTDPSGSYYVLTSGAAAPAISASIWGKYLCRASGRRNSEAAYSLIDESTSFQVLSPTLHLEDIGYRETNQFNPRTMWTGPLKALLRVVDGLSVGGGSSVGNWTGYTPTISAADPPPSIGNGTIAGKWRTVGQSVEVAIYLAFGSTTSFGGSSISLSMPPSKTIDTSKLPGGVIVSSSVYLSSTGAPTSSRGGIVIGDLGNTSIQVRPTGTASNVDSATPFTWVSGDEMFISFSTPVF